MAIAAILYPHHEHSGGTLVKPQERRYGPEQGPHDFKGSGFLCSSNSHFCELLCRGLGSDRPLFGCCGVHCKAVSLSSVVGVCTVLAVALAVKLVA